ncbi:MAG TPA: M12 family metallo-peptidase [Allocoleopsis sp.]
MAVNLFDVNFYRANNLDLSGFNDQQALNHFNTFGLNENRIFSPYVNLSLYRASNPDLTRAGLTSNRQILDHLQNFGIREGRVFSEFVDINLYLALNNDVNRAFGGDKEKGFEHLRQFGINENRVFSPFVDLSFYLGLYNDVNQAFNGNRFQAFQHLQQFGLNEKRGFSPFVDLNFYLKTNNDVNQAFGGNHRQSLQHLLINGLNEKRSFSPFVDLNYYLQNNNDVNQAFGGNYLKSLTHLIEYGLAEKRQFSLVYETNYYRNHYTDLTPYNDYQLFQQFQMSGLSQGRASSSNFNVSYYLANNADLKALNYTNKQALEHFVIYGIKEGRKGVPANSDPIVIDTPDPIIPPVSSDDGSVLDLMIVYTPNARQYEGGTSGINNLINLAVTQANQAFSNSGVNTKLRLVHSQEINYNETGNGELDLERLQGKNDGYMNVVHTLRDNYGADIVSLFVSDSDVGGIAYIMNENFMNEDFSAYAFSLVQTDAARYNYSLSHEIGHILGATHDRANSDSPGIFPYSYGYIANSGTGDIMSYSDNRINYFSSPNITLNNGEKLGRSDLEDVVKTFNQTRLIAAKWRQSK